MESWKKKSDPEMEGQNQIQIPSMWQDKIGLANFDQDQALLSFEDTNPWSTFNEGGSFKEKEVVPRSSLGESRS